MLIRTSNSGSDPASHGVYRIQEECHIGRGDADVLDHDGQVIAGHVVARKLPKPGHGNNEHESVQPIAGLEQAPQVKAGPGRPAPDLGQRVFNLLHLDSDDGMVRIPVGVEIDNNPIHGEAIKMTDSQMQKEADYYMAQKLLKQLLSAGLISLDEFDKITELNRKKFSPVLAEIMS